MHAHLFLGDLERGLMPSHVACVPVKYLLMFFSKPHSLKICAPQEDDCRLSMLIFDITFVLVLYIGLDVALVREPLGVAGMVREQACLLLSAIQ